MRKAIVMIALAHASTWAAAQPSPTTPAERPVASFICGGVSQGEQERMKSEAPRHDLMLTFAVDTGAYLADVDVQIRDARGTVIVAAKCGGPIMLVDLPRHENWYVTAQSNGRSREKTITAGAGHAARAIFVWPAGA
jgi:hypothetical protein